MTFGESFAWFCVISLAIFGCAQAIRRLCLWLTRCPRCFFCCRLAIPRQKAELAPLVRCLHSQTVWDDPTICRHTLVVLPSDVDISEEEIARIFEEAPTVIPITCEDLTLLVAQEMKE